MKKLLLFILLLGSFAAFSQGTVTGTLLDGETGETLPSANVVETGTSNGTVADMDGNFTLNVSKNQGAVTVSFVGYSSKKINYTLVNGSANLGSVSLDLDADALGEVVIVGKGVIDLAGGRETPVAVTTILAEEIQRKAIGNVEITEAVKSAPSTHVSGESGFGDSQLYLRGFDQSNIAILLNGQPVNGMEDGLVYWSNWAGVADIATAIQVQRGLGASKLAISSVGGTTNIVMKAADRKAGGFARFLGGNDSYAKGTVAYNTGINDNGWAFSALVDYWQAHRKWSKGTYGQGQNYFFAVGYKPNETHAFNFLITGAPQLHGQKWSQSKERIAADPKFNEHWGYTSDGIESERQNYYHKPVINLNWDWDISDVTDLSTVAYASWGRGGGTGNLGSSSARKRTEDPDGDGPLIGQIDYDAIAANNAIVGVGGDYGGEFGSGYIRRASVNNHQWFGMVSNLNHEFSKSFNVNVGADLRFYRGDHFRQVTDLYGLSGWDDNGTDNPGLLITATFDPTPWAALSNFADEGDRIGYDYSENINYQGIFGQMEYATDVFSMFVQGAFSNQSYQRDGRFIEDEDGLGKSDKVSKTGYNVKGGLSYTIAGDHKIYANAGYYSRQPYLDNIFVDIRSSNELIKNPEVDNQTITSFEGGYHFKSNRIKANFNAYVTDWDNRTLTDDGIDDNGTPKDETDDFEINIIQRGIRQFHTGAEFDISFKASDWLTLQGFLSGGRWIYKGESSVFIYNDATGALISESDGVNRDGVKVSNAPQLTMGLGGLVKIVKGLSVDASIKHQERHYEYTDVNTSATDYMPSRLSPYAITDAGLTYDFDLGSNELTFRANVYNVFDYIRLSNSDAFGYYTTNGRTYNGSIKYSF
ncbi:outer membrane receptor protein involved in Fe transport [Ulvibacter sp. MAR_2010_11]|uniref:TonB-dependent receptor n=1 Tax=Ulvibacter sp. MAR_2010_11 TaxID=1250229 RepID=UPI000C2C1939|nr:TonB-dependent receptor [Ulvibacter sp. MAR_2010_11]PKA82792.1 outer membrane receptor protein involved in Fe transport [Ulvibacter sp. MAR_2010_11]